MPRQKLRNIGTWCPKCLTWYDGFCCPVGSVCGDYSRPEQWATGRPCDGILESCDERYEVARQAAIASQRKELI